MLSKLGLVSALLPAALACLGYEGGVPTPTDHVSSSSVIMVEAGEVFDGGWKKYDRGSGACKEQTEGGKFALSLTIQGCQALPMGSQHSSAAMITTTFTC